MPKVPRRRARNRGTRKNLLFYWRSTADMSQTEIAELLSLSADQISDFESDKRPLEGQGLLIIRWAAACGIAPASPQVQVFLYNTGNAQFLPDPDCPQCRAELSACVAHLHDRHHDHSSARSPFDHLPLTPNDRRILMEEITANQQAMPKRHPYATYAEARQEQL